MVVLTSQKLALPAWTEAQDLRARGEFCQTEAVRTPMRTGPETADPNGPPPKKASHAWTGKD